MKSLQKFSTSCVLFFFGSLIYAQDGLDIDVDLTDDTPSLFSNPYFWIGVAAVIIIVALILSLGKKK